MAEMSPDQSLARELMSTMVETGPFPDEGNMAFVEAVEAQAADLGLDTRVVSDPSFPDKALLIAEAGPVWAEQTLVGVSHADVVGVEGQQWQTDPRKLHEHEGRWYGRGTCDTHGSGVAMLLAAASPEVAESLRAHDRRISIIFTFDEEATSPELSMRGARLALGQFGVEPVVTADYFIAGEPTEQGGQMVPMRGHKGRYLAHFTVSSPDTGHVSEVVGNALMSGARIVGEIGTYARIMRYGSAADQEAQIFNPPHTTAQVSAAKVKHGDYSTTPATARFTVDMRTLPFVHELRATEVTDLIEACAIPAGDTVEIEIEKSAPGSMTAEDSPIVTIAEEVTGQAARGFNGGDEGRIMRLEGGLQGVTLGPGELHHAHMPDESVAISSVMNAVGTYRQLFVRAAEFDPPGTAR